MASSSSHEQSSWRKKAAGVTSASGDVTSASGNIRAGKRAGASPFQARRVVLELRREEDEGLGMILTVEEDFQSPSGRTVLVKSLTPGGAAERARCLSQDDVTTEAGFRVHDRLLQIDEHVLDDMGEEDCLDVLQEIPETCVMVVQRSSSTKTSRIGPVSPRSTGLSNSGQNSTTEFSREKNPEEYTHSSTKTSPLSSGSSNTTKPPVPPSRKSRSSEGADFRGIASKLGASGEEGSGRVFPKGRDGGAPRPPARKVRRQRSTAAHLAERGLPGFVVRRVTVSRRREGESLGLSIVPSCGATKFYYQVKRLLPGGVCAQTPGLHEGDRLLECNGHSLQGLTQARCLDILKAAGPKVTLTLLHEKREPETGDENRAKPRSPRDLHPELVPAKSLEKTRGVESSEGRVKRVEGVEKSRVAPVNGSSPRARTDQSDSSPLKVPPGPAPDKTSPRKPDTPRTVSNPPNTTATSRDGRRGVAAATAASSTRKLSQKTSQGLHAEDMSNPFLDPDPPLQEGGEGGGLSQSGGKDSHLSGLSSSNPFYSDVVFGGGGEDLQMSAVDSNNPFYADVVLGGGGGEEGVHVSVGSSRSETHGQSFPVEDENDRGAVLTEDVLLDMGDDIETKTSQSFTLAEPVDLLGGLSAASNEPGVNIPPPMEFSDSGDVVSLEPQSVLAGNDLRSSDFPASVEESSASGEEKVSRNGSQSNGSEEGFDFLLDAAEAPQQQQAPSLMMDIVEEEQESPHPPLPRSPPPAVPQEDSEGVGDGSSLQLGIGGKMDVDTEKVQGDGKKPSLPANAFALTSVGITKKLLANSSRAEAEEEEEITPMTVHRDHQGNKLAAPSSKPDLGKPLTGPRRKLDEGAKRDLQSVMSRMTSVPRRTKITIQNGSENNDDAPHVREEEIVPVKLTRKEADMAGEVLSRWSSGQSKTSVFIPRGSSKTSGFQKVVGTVLDVQAGRTELPGNSVFLTTMGVTRTPALGREVEEEITPMSVHKDHLGNKHYAPSAAQDSRVKLTAPRQLDKAAKLDIAALMSSMPARRTRTKKPEDSSETGIQEDAITPTVLTKNESRIAMDAVSRWMNKDADDAEKSQSKPSAFQRLVKNVVETASKAEDEAEENQHEDLEQQPERKKEEKPSSKSTEDEITHSVSVSNTFSSPPKPKPEPPPVEETKTEKPPPPTTSPKPPPPPVMPKPTSAERKALLEDSVHACEEPPRKSPRDENIDAKPTAAKETKTSPPRADTRPVPTQRTLRGPGKIASLSQTSSLSSVKPFSKIGTLSVTNRNVTPSMLTHKPLPSSSSSSSAQYGRTRSEEAPFLVEVLKGIVGLGIKVKVTEEGHVKVTEVQRNSPVSRSGTVREGDYLLSVNGTELEGLSDSRVQQILRLLPRVLVKLVVSTRPPLSADSQKAESTDQHPSEETSSPRSAGGYTQYGVRLSPQPFSPTPSDGQPPSFTHREQADSGEPLSTDEDEDMATRKLSKALSPRYGQTFEPDPSCPPRPSPRQRQGSSSLAATPRGEEPTPDEARDSSTEDQAKKAERPLTVSEIVAAASRRPSGRDDDLPPPPPAHRPGEALDNGGDDAGEDGSRHPAPPGKEDSRAPSGMFSPRENAPVFAAVARKVSPVPTPRPKARSSFEDGGDLHAGPTPRDAGDEEKKAVVDEVVHAHAANVSHAAPPPAKPKIPPPVAPKPKRTSSMSSDKSYSSVHSDEAPPRDLPSPTVGSSRLRDFAEASAPVAADEPSQNRVSSAARMFERKATEVKPVSPLTHPLRSSVPVSSVVKNFNRTQDSEPSGKSEVVMRRVSVGVSSRVSGGGEEGDGKRLNSALVPPGDRRRSMPSQLSGSLHLTKPSSLSHLRHQPSPRGGGGANSISEEGESDSKTSSPRFNAALRPRSAFPTSSSPLRSVLTPREHKEKPTPASDADSDSSDVTYRQRPASAREATPRKATSWTSQAGDGHSPRMIFTSSSLHSTPRHGTSSSSWGSEQPDQLESTMKKFDDLLSDKHTFDSDEELPKVSNSVSLDLLKNRGARKAATTSESSGQAAADPVAKDSPAPVTEPKSVSDRKSLSEESVEKNSIAKGTVNESLPPAKSDTTTTPDVSKTDEVSGDRVAAVEEETRATSVPAAESSFPAEKTDKIEREEKIESNQLQQTERETKPEQPKEVEKDVQQSSDQSQTNEETSPAVPGTVPEKPHEKPPAQPPQPKARKSRQVVEEAEDAYPEEDTAAALDLPATEHLPPAEDKTSEADVSLGEDHYPEEDSVVPMASSIVQTVISNALKDVTSRPKLEKPTEEDEEDSPPPPPLPTEEPPPLPGAPPPPLIMREMMGTLVDSEDLEGMLPSQGNTSARSSPRSQSDLAANSTEESPRNPPDPAEALQSEDVEVKVEEEAVNANAAAPNFSLPLQQKFPEEPEEDTEPAKDSDVLISFHSPPSERLPLTSSLPSTELTGGGVEDDLKEKKLDQAHEEQPPVSDTLSQDSGVQDEDMSEDGLRFSHDESPTSQGDSSVFTMTPDDLPVSKETEVTHTSLKSPVPSPRSKLSPPAPRSLPPSTTPAAENEAQPHPREESASVQDVVQSADPLKNSLQNDHDDIVHNKNNVDIETSKPTTEEKHLPQPPKKSPRRRSDQEDLDSPTSPTTTDSESAKVESSRKWVILDQSGSLFLHGEKNSAVPVRRDALRQVSSLRPGELAGMLSEANRDLDEARLPDNVELRAVAARGLSGRSLSLEVTQREDYFVQVTRVHSKDSVVEEADLLLAVDGRSLKHRRPAQVHSQLESTGPKGTLLTARGVKLPVSLLRLHEERTSESDSNSESPRSISSPRSAPSTPAVQVSPGVYDVIMVKGATGVGFCLEGGKASPKGDLPILIKRIFKGGPAEKCGQLQVKDEILAVNGVDFTLMRHYEAWNHLKFLDDGEIHLRIRRQED